IDLVGGTEDPNGVTANDFQDGDGGANNLQNYPVLTGITVNTAGAGMKTLTIDGTLNSTPGQTFTVELFLSPAQDPSHFGEGKLFLGSVTTAATDANGDVTFTFTSNALADALLEGKAVVTATATDATNDTSEFSRALGLFVVTNTHDSGGGS